MCETLMCEAYKRYDTVVLESTTTGRSGELLMYVTSAASALGRVPLVAKDSQNRTPDCRIACYIQDDGCLRRATRNRVFKQGRHKLKASAMAESPAMTAATKTELR